MLLGLKVFNLPILTKLFIWSIVLEPLLFFIIIEVNLIGMGGHIARFLQVIVLACLGLKFLVFRSKMSLPNPFNKKFRAIWLYVFFVLFSTIVSLLFFNIYSFDYSLIISIRPYLEIIILFYTIFYYVYLPQYFLINSNSINYFFEILIKVFLFSLLIGILDLALQFFFPGFDLIPRHLLDNVDVGVRFHGLFGEPRDAFGALALLLAVMYLKDYCTGEIKKRRFFILLIATMGIFTFSFSSLLAIIFSITLIFIYYFFRLETRGKIKSIGVIIAVSTVLVISATKSDRLFRYLEDIDDTIIQLTNGIFIDSIYSSQRQDILPVWARVNDLRNLNLTPLLIGSGAGSSSFESIDYAVKFNKNINESNSTNQFNSQRLSIEVSNPKSNIIRIVYEVGIIGLLLFFNVFLSSLKYQRNYPRQILLSMLILLGCFLAHRSYIPFIYLGLLLAVFRHKENDNFH